MGCVRRRTPVDTLSEARGGAGGAGGVGVDAGAGARSRSQEWSESGFLNIFILVQNGVRPHLFDMRARVRPSGMFTAPPPPPSPPPPPPQPCPHRSAPLVGQSAVYSWLGLDMDHLPTIRAAFVPHPTPHAQFCHRLGIPSFGSTNPHTCVLQDPRVGTRPHHSHSVGKGGGAPPSTVPESSLSTLFG